MITDYEIQPFSLDCYPLMKQLFQSAFNSSLNFESFIKKYDTKSLGHEVIGFIAIHKPTKEPAAYYGVFPVKILINGVEVLAAQSGDTMTHQNHRKKGLFRQLAQLAIQECENKGVQLIFGQPNQYSKHGLVNSLKFTHLDDIIRFDLKLRIKTIPLPKWSKKLGWYNSYHEKYARRFLIKKIIATPKEFTNSLDSLPLKVLRNQSYLNYKSSNDKIFIRINNAVFWIKLDDVMWIGDIDDYDKVDMSTIKKIKKLAFVLGYNTISFHFNKSLDKPGFLMHFKEQQHELSCFYYLNKQYTNHNMILTGADFDTW
jgi:hypothetical protein